MSPFDYLVIGHVTRDLMGSSFRLGGTAAYAARTARALGCQVGIVTSFGPDLDLSDALGEVPLARVPALESTTFENTRAEGARRQFIRSVAAPLGLQTVPPDWQARLAHIGPVARECSPELTSGFAGAFVGVTPQGWMRQWDDGGHVVRRRWEEADQVLPHSDAVVLSDEDVGGDRDRVAEYARQTPCLVLTQGAAGCTVYVGGEVRRVPAPSVDELDATGAGDIFAAALFYALQRGHDAWTAASFANCIAARSVTRSGLMSTPSREEVVHCRRATLRSEENDAHHLRAG